MTTKTNTPVGGDLVKYEFHQSHCRASGTFKNSSGAAITDRSILGTPVKLSAGNWIPVAAADIANAEGLLLHDDLVDSLPDATVLDVEVAVLVRGPAGVLLSQLPTTDIAAGASINMTNFETRLNALGIVVLDAPPETETQTT